MNSCLLPGIDYPVLVLIGASGSGRTCVGAAAAEMLNAPFVESEDIAEERLGIAVGAQFNQDAKVAQAALDEAAVEALREGGVGAGAVVALSASAPLSGEVRDALDACRHAGSPVVALEASLPTLSQRTGLNAQRPVFLGTPRAWFRAQIAELEAAYGKVADHFFETDATTCEEAAARIVETVRLDSNGWI